MTRKLRILFLAFFLALAIPLSVAATTSAASAATPACPTGWGSLPKSSALMGTAEVDNVRAGQHLCFDRLVITVDGPPAGYLVQYVTQVTADGSGAMVTTPGRAKLQVVVRHPSFAPTKVGSSVANVNGFRTFRSVVYAGSFEGQTTYGLGVRARLPFRVFTIAGGHGRIVVDVARQW